MSKKAKYNKTMLFFKTINSKLTKNIMHQVKSLGKFQQRSFITQDVSYDYKKNDKYRRKGKHCRQNLNEKFEQKIWHKNDVPAN